MKYQTTGSDSWNNTPAACFVDGNTAAEQYGVAKRFSEGCPKCHGPVDALLAFNPTDSYYYLAPCPICGRFIRYCDLYGNLAFKVMVSTKTTEIDQDLEVESRYDY